MASLRAWLMSFLLATTFAMGVVAIMTADPQSMLDEEDSHAQETWTETETAESESHAVLELAPPHVRRVDEGVPTGLPRFARMSSDGPTREHRRVLHRPPAI